jgi:PAS domain S-box-containing protein
LPIKIKDKIWWILNIEDARLNAFTNDDQRILEHICSDVKFVLDHLFDFYILDEIIHGASDFIIITDTTGNIVQLNPAAEYGLGIENDEAQGRSIGSFLPDADRARFVIESRKVAPEETELVAKDGNLLTVLLSGRLLPEEFGRKVFFARNLMALRRLEELETISRVLYEIAAHARTPLSLASGWLSRIKGDLAKRSNDIGNIRHIADVVDKAMRQLKKVELPYERVLLTTEKSGGLPYNGRLLDIVRLVDDTVADLPEADQSRIAKRLRARFRTCAATRSNLPLSFGPPCPICSASCPRTSASRCACTAWTQPCTSSSRESFRNTRSREKRMIRPRVFWLRYRLASTSSNVSFSNMAGPMSLLQPVETPSSASPCRSGKGWRPTWWGMSFWCCPTRIS